MSIKTTDKSFSVLTRQRLSTSSRLNTYNPFRITETNQYFLNIFKAFEIVDEVKDDNKYFTTITALEDEWWDNISFQHYGTSYYWYLLCELNDIINPYEQLVPGQSIKVLRQSYLYDVFKNMTKIAKL